MQKLEARNITKTFTRGTYSPTILNGINLKVDEGEFVCLVGPSGCGKSTFLKILVNLSMPTSGEVLFNGKTVTKTEPSRLMVFQKGALFPWLNVRDNVEFGLKTAGIKKEERALMSEKFLDMMQLTDYADSPVRLLSGGMYQRAAIARALVMDPEVLCMDEPFSSLDPQTRNDLIMETQLLWKKTKKTIIFVTHNHEEAILLGTRIIVFSHRPAVIHSVFENPLPHPRNPTSTQIVQLKRELKQTTDSIKLASSSGV